MKPFVNLNLTIKKPSPLEDLSGNTNTNILNTIFIVNNMLKPTTYFSLFRKYTEGMTKLDWLVRRTQIRGALQDNNKGEVG